MAEEVRGWREFFDRHAPHYMENVFVRNTAAEVDFLLRELRPAAAPGELLAGGSSILDIGCGTGRHAVELARRGYRVTGVDISAGMLAEARQAAAAAGVEVEWVEADATRFVASRPHDAAICLCEGAFGLIGEGDDPVEHDLAILRSIAAALRPGSRFLMTTLNGFAKVRSLEQDDVNDGRFDPVTMVHELTEEWDLPGGSYRMRYRERQYMPSELVLLFRQAGLTVDHVWGGTAGNWGHRPLDLDEIEVMLVATRR